MNDSQRQYRLVIFDLDGTLLDSLHDIAYSANCVLSAKGYPAHAIDAYKRFVGDGMAMLFTRALPEAARQDAVIGPCVELMKVEYGRHWNDVTKPYPQMLDLLDALNQRGLRLAVLSNKPQAFTEKCIDAHFRNGLFARVFGQRDNVPRKPDPAGAIQIANELAVAVGECVYVGDSSVDMQTAVSAGMFPVGATWGFRSRQELEKYGAKAIIDAPLELLPILDQATGE